MASIDHELLTRLMDMAGETPASLAASLHPPITTSYMARICKGERKLKRNPVLRAQIARRLGVPTRCIEAESTETAA